MNIIESIKSKDGTTIAVVSQYEKYAVASTGDKDNTPGFHFAYDWDWHYGPGNGDSFISALIEESQAWTSSKEDAINVFNQLKMDLNHE